MSKFNTNNSIAIVVYIYKVLCGIDGLCLMSQHSSVRSKYSNELTAQKIFLSFSKITD